MNIYQEKAREIVGNMQFQQNPLMFEVARSCALIAVDEILKSKPLEPNNVDWNDYGAEFEYWYHDQKDEAFIFWNNVRNEIEKL
jgi:hypothetical protein